MMHSDDRRLYTTMAAGWALGIVLTVAVTVLLRLPSTPAFVFGLVCGIFGPIIALLFTDP